jgi:hypothetical protein
MLAAESWLLGLRSSMGTMRVKLRTITNLSLQNKAVGVYHSILSLENIKKKKIQDESKIECVSKRECD